MIDISKMDKAKVLKALYAAARPQGMGFLHYTPGPMRDEAADAMIASKHLYFDYVDGRVMKVDLASDTLDPRLFDRDNGDGAAERALRDAGLLQ